MRGRVLTIAGSDSGGGAGIQADLKTITALGGYAASAITALTAQNTLGVQAVLPVPSGFVTQQIESVLGDIGADAIKTGMLHDAGVIAAVADAVEALKRNPTVMAGLDPAIHAVAPGDGSGARGKEADAGHSIPSGFGAERSAWMAGSSPAMTSGKSAFNERPLVVDPVMVATSGSLLLQPDAVAVLKARLLPLATLLTPNLPEAAALTGLAVTTRAQMAQAAQALLDMGLHAVLVKGGHLPGDEIADLLATPDGLHWFEDARLPGRNTHGTGCTLASAIATGLAQGMALHDAVIRARRYLRAAIAAAPRLGQGHGPLNHAAGNQLPVFMPMPGGGVVTA